jgi:predicted short-subunit dehydrogenase-like oxidoreductase (DUF2520 family)
MKTRHTVAVIGAGRVATGVATLLQRAGHVVVGVGPRGRDSSRRAAGLLSVDEFDIGRIPRCDVLLLGVPEAAVAEVAAAVGSRIADQTVVCHFAGSLGTDSLAAAGGRACAAHPVQTCPDVERAIANLPGSAWGVTCADDVWSWAQGFVGSVEGRAVRIEEHERPAWHAASVVTANGISALLAVAEGIISELGIGEPERVLAPLAAGAVNNARTGGGAATLTGPVVRGEVGSVARHLDHLLGSRLDGYRRVAELILHAAAVNNRLDEETRARMQEVIGS